MLCCHYGQGQLCLHFWVLTPCLFQDIPMRHPWLWQQSQLAGWGWDTFISFLLNQS